MKIIDEIAFALFEMGAARITQCEGGVMEFDIHGVRFMLNVDMLRMRAGLTCTAIDETRMAEEGLCEDDIVGQANIMSKYIGSAAFYVSDAGEGVYCRTNFAFANSADAIFNLENAIEELLILRDASLRVACDGQTDELADARFIHNQVARAAYDHLKDRLECNILYVHGFRSTGSSSTARNLSELLPRCKVVSPDLPVNAEDAVALLKSICETEKIDVAIGTSMGGMLAQKLRGIPKILVNPSFSVSATFKKNMGPVSYFKERADGATEFVITPEVVESYAKIEKRQFCRITPAERAITVGVFGNEDTTVNCKDKYLHYYDIIRQFTGGHRLNKEVLQDVIVPLVAQLYRNARRTADVKKKR